MNAIEGLLKSRNFKVRSTKKRNLSLFVILVNNRFSTNSFGNDIFL
jgi:hypothetical protein